MARTMARRKPLKWLDGVVEGWVWARGGWGHPPHGLHANPPSPPVRAHRRGTTRLASPSRPRSARPRAAAVGPTDAAATAAG